MIDYTGLESKGPLCVPGMRPLQAPSVGHLPPSLKPSNPAKANRMSPSDRAPCTNIVGIRPHVRLLERVFRPHSSNNICAHTVVLGLMSLCVIAMCEPVAELRAHPHARDRSPRAPLWFLLEESHLLRLHSAVLSFLYQIVRLLPQVCCCCCLIASCWVWIPICRCCWLTEMPYALLGCTWCGTLACSHAGLTGERGLGWKHGWGQGQRAGGTN